MNKLPISVCMISGAEAKRIGNSLASVAPWASEIIVVINEDVADGTDKIAESFGAKVFREPWKGYVRQKASAAEKASHSWVIGLDSDETVSEALRAEIDALFAEPKRLAQHAAYQFPRCTMYSGRWIRHGEWYPDYCTRLWRKDLATPGGIDPHDKLVVKGSIGRLKHELLHFSNESIDHQVRKTIAYSNEFLRHCQETGRIVSYAEIWVRPAWRFFRAYVLRRGFMDGWQGYAIAWMAAFYTFLRYTKVYEAQRHQKT